MTDVASTEAPRPLSSMEIVNLYDEVMQRGLAPVENHLDLGEVRPALVACTTSEPGYAWTPGHYLVEYYPGQDVVRFSRLAYMFGTAGRLTVDRYSRVMSALDTGRLQMGKRAVFLFQAADNMASSAHHRSLPVDTIRYL